MVLGLMVEEESFFPLLDLLYQNLADNLVAYSFLTKFLTKLSFLNFCYQS